MPLAHVKKQSFPVNVWPPTLNNVHLQLYLPSPQREEATCRTCWRFPDVAGELWWIQDDFFSSPAVEFASSLGMQPHPSLDERQKKRQWEAEQKSTVQCKAWQGKKLWFQPFRFEPNPFKVLQFWKKFRSSFLTNLRLMKPRRGRKVSQPFFSSLCPDVLKEVHSNNSGRTKMFVKLFGLPAVLDLNLTSKSWFLRTHATCQVN